MNQTIKTTPKDFFFHLGALIALYTSVYALISLTFSVINYLAPDQLAGFFSSYSIAWPISTLIILAPVLYILEWLISKDISVVLEKRDIWIRRWRIYLTLFLSGLMVVIDLIILINTYLGGEISSRFIFKVLAVLIIAGVVFKYYFFSLNETMKWASFEKKVVPWFGIVLVLAAIVTGFILVGSPAKQRAIRFDTQRENDLQNIQWQVLSYWQQKNKLPSALKDLNDSISGSIIPVDPESNTPYEYSVKPTSTTSFQLCAIFALPYQDIGTIKTDWNHQAGRTCFDRTIDPEKYPPVKRVM